VDESGTDVTASVDASIAAGTTSVTDFATNDVANAKTAIEAITD